MAKIYVIHENEAWIEPLLAAFVEQSLPYEEWFLSEGVLDFDAVPPEGVFYNRMSASSHTRDHRFAAEYTSCVLPWLEKHHRRLVNGSRALQLEVNKVAQYASLAEFGVKTPRTLAAVGRRQIVERYQRFIAANGIDVAGIEFIADAAGEIYTYDVNTNTNYNSAAEEKAGTYSMRAVASFLGRELKARYQHPARA